MNLLESLFLNRNQNKSLDARKNPNRAFGRDITNLHADKTINPHADKPKPNHTLQQKPNPKIEGREQKNRSKSITPPQSPTEKNSLEEYETDIMNQLLKDNKCAQPMKCSGISVRMRAILIDWLVDVHSQFQLKEESLHLAVRILDEYCAKGEEISKKTLQLVGITCLWMASKYEEIYPPKMKNYVVVTDNTYTQTEIHEMEARILECLNFRILLTTHHQFLSAVLGADIDTNVGSFCRYLIELSLFEMLNTEYKPSVLVLSTLQMSETLLKQKTPLKKFKEIFQVEQDEVNRCFKHLCKLVNGSSWQELMAIKRKYNKPKFHSVGRIKLERI